VSVLINCENTLVLKICEQLLVCLQALDVYLNKSALSLFDHDVHHIVDLPTIPMVLLLSDQFDDVVFLSDF